MSYKQANKHKTHKKTKNHKYNSRISFGASQEQRWYYRAETSFQKPLILLKSNILYFSLKDSLLVLGLTFQTPQAKP